MLRKVIATVALMGVAVLGAHAQGTVEFKTSGDAQRITLGGVNISGTAGMAQLYAAAGLNAPEASLQAVGAPSAFRAGLNAGLINGPVTTIPFATQGGPVTLQIRAWAGSATSFEAATGDKGMSTPFNLSSTGNPAGDPPTVPVALTGFQGFNIVAIPEPSSIALGILGVAGLALFRRRK